MSADRDRGGSAFQDWTLDALGNWNHFDGPSLSQDRTHDAANQITDIDGGGWVEPTYDDAGNMVSGPKPGAETTEYKFVYDAWNRLVKVTDSAGTTTIAEYRYDGLGRRIAKLVPNGENWDRTDYHYNEAWQCLEERYAGGLSEQNRNTPAETPNVQWLWDARYIDAPVLRWRSVSGTLDEVLYFCNDANMNVTAMVNTDGTVAERYVYDAYGKATVYDDDWSTTVAWDDSVKNEVRYGGYRFDPETGLDHVRYRYYHPTLGRWIERDPIGYEGGNNLHAYAADTPADMVDPDGLAPRFTGVPPEPVKPATPTPTAVNIPPDLGDMDLGMQTQKNGTTLTVHYGGVEFLIARKDAQVMGGLHETKDYRSQGATQRPDDQSFAVAWRYSKEWKPECCKMQPQMRIVWGMSNAVRPRMQLLHGKITDRNWQSAVDALSGDYANAAPYMTSEIVAFHEGQHVRQYMQMAVDAWKQVTLDENRHRTRGNCKSAANKARAEWSQKYRSIVPQFGPDYQVGDYEGPAWDKTFPEMRNLARDIEAQFGGF